MITAAGMSAMPVTGLIVHRITGERAQHQKLSAALLHVALVTYYSKKNTHPRFGKEEGCQT